MSCKDALHPTLDPAPPCAGASGGLRQARMGLDVRQLEAIFEYGADHPPNQTPALTYPGVRQ